MKNKKKTRDPAIVSREEFSLYSYILFKEYGDEYNAAFFEFKKGYLDKDLREYENSNRDYGFKFKKSGDLEKAKEAFLEAACENDPISQYELVHLLGKQEDQSQHLLEMAAPRLFQAKISLYELYLQNRDYESASVLLKDLMELRRKLEAFYRKSLEVKELPHAPQRFVIYSNEAKYYDTKDEGTGKWVQHKLPFFHEILYRHALNQVGDTQTHLMNLAALNGNAAAAVHLYQLNAEKREQEERARIKEMLALSKCGNSVATERLINLAKSGDAAVLNVLFEMSLIENKICFYIKLLEESTINGSPNAECALGQMYYGQHTKEIGCLYTKGTQILSSQELRVKVEKLAEARDVSAQYYMGVMGKESREYSTALKWFSRAATHYLPALHELGELYEFGLYMGMHNASTDLEQAAVCYRKCAELGYARSQHALGLLAFHKKDFAQARHWLEKSAAQGYAESVDYLRRVLKSSYEQELKDWAETAVVALEGVFSEHGKQEDQEKTGGKDKGETSLHKGTMDQAGQESQSVSILQKQPSLEEEEEKADQHEPLSTGAEGGRDANVLSFTGVVYDDPRWVTEAQLDATLAQAGRGLQGNGGFDARSSRLCGANLLDMQQSALGNDLGLSAPTGAVGEAKWPAVILPWWSALDEKLMAQASFFAHGGVVFETLRDALHTGAAFLSGGWPQEEARDDAYMFDAFSLSHFQHALHEFSHFLDFSL